MFLSNTETRRAGTAVVRRPHRETIVADRRRDELSLGIWFADQSWDGRDKLVEPQRDALSELGVDWA